MGTARNNRVQRDEEDCVIAEIPGTLAHVQGSNMAVWLREWMLLLGSPITPLALQRVEQACLLRLPTVALRNSPHENRLSVADVASEAKDP